MDALHGRVEYTDRRYTPGWVRELAQRATPGGLVDMASEARNPMGLPAAMTPDGLLKRGQLWPVGTGLSVDWSALVEWAAPGGAAWCNPPFSDLTPWLRKALAGAPVLLLTPVDFTTGWWRMLRDRYVMRCELDRRVRCDSPAGDQYDVARSCALWGLGPISKRLFRGAFASAGEVIERRIA